MGTVFVSQLGGMLMSPHGHELRQWLADEGELGYRVAREFMETARCPGQAITFGGRRSFCQAGDHYVPIGDDRNLHLPPAAGLPVSSFMAADINRKDFW